MTCRSYDIFKYITALLLSLLLLMFAVSCTRLDKSPLEEALRLKAYKSGYTNDSWNEYCEAYSGAESLLESTSTSQADIDAAAERLTAAYKALSKAADFSSLESALATVVDASKYTDESYAAYATARNAALNIYNSGSTVKQSDVNNAISRLQETYKALVVRVDMSKLNALLSQTVVESLYTSKTYGYYSEVRAMAQQLVSSRDTNELYAKLLTDELSLAMSMLARRGNVAPLTDTIKYVNPYYDGTAGAAHLSKTAPALFYSSASYNLLSELLAGAKEYAASGDISDSDIMSLSDDLRKAVTNLIPRPDKTPLSVAVAAAKSYNISRFTPESFAVLGNEIIAIEPMLAPEYECTAEEIDAAILRLNAAVRSLVLLRVIPNGLRNTTFDPFAFTVGEMSFGIAENNKNMELLSAMLASDPSAVGMTLSRSFDPVDNTEFITLNCGLMISLTSDGFTVSAMSDVVSTFDGSGISVFGIGFSDNIVSITEKYGKPAFSGVDGNGNDILTYGDDINGVTVIFSFPSETNTLNSITVKFEQVIV